MAAPARTRPGRRPEPLPPVARRTLSWRAARARLARVASSNGRLRRKWAMRQWLPASTRRLIDVAAVAPDVLRPFVRRREHGERARGARRRCARAPARARPAGPEPAARARAARVRVVGVAAGAAV